MLAEIKIDGLSELIKNFERAPIETYNNIKVAINQSAIEISEAIKKETPVGKKNGGTLKSGIFPEFSELTAVIRPHNAPYAGWVHNGTKPYDIHPVKKQALYWDGAPHPCKVVHHPGIKANPFMERGLNIILPKVEKIFNDAISKILSILSKK